MRFDRLPSTRFSLTLLAVTLASGCGGDKLVSGGARLSANPGSLDFGDVDFGVSVDRVLTLTNPGSATLAFEQLSIADAHPGFSLGAFPTTLAAGEQTTVTVRWTAPGTPSSASTKLLIDSNAENAPTLEVPLVARAHAPSTDAGVTDAGVTDAGVTDAGVTDAGVTDAGVTDAGVTDAGVTDAGVTDAGVTDAGVTDAGAADAGVVDAGITDAGVDAGIAVVQLSGSLDHFCALRADGSVVCWGPDGTGVPVEKTGLPPASQVAAGSEFTCALASGTGEVWCWGVNNAGQLGNGATSATPSTAPSRVVGLSGVRAISAASGSACAILGNRQVACWGNNPRGELGDGTTTNASSPVMVSTVANVDAIAVGDNSSCARATNGTVWCWGSNSSNTLGLSLGDAPTPQVVAALQSVTQLHVGYNLACATRSNGEVACWGTDVGPTPAPVSGLSNAASVAARFGLACAARHDGTVACWSPNGSHGAAGEMGDGDTVAHTTPTTVPGLAGVVSVAVSTNTVCALRDSGTVWCWGNNLEGETGAGWTGHQLTPSAVVLAPRSDTLSAGRTQSCGVSDGGAWCVGENVSGALGDGSRVDRHVATSVALTQVAQIDVSGGLGCARRTDGTAWCWGLGTLTPARVVGVAGVTDLAAGFDFACAVSGGQVWCWGSNSRGQLGAGSTALTQSASPLLVPGLSGVVKLSAREQTLCAMTASGALWCWGRNDGGQLGDGTVVDRPSATLVAGVSDARSISVGTYTTCTLRATGAVLCWGSRLDGLGGLVRDATPTAFGASTDFTEVAVGKFRVCARRQSGQVVCAGDNAHGALCNGSRAFVGAPTVITELFGLTRLATGAHTTCALRPDGTPLCCGGDWSGQSGTGRDNRVPQPVLMP